MGAELVRRELVGAGLPALPGRDRTVAAAGAVRPGVRLGEGQDEILALADGRRTARDVAFALGRGVYATMLQLTRMRQAGLLTTVSSRASGAGQEPGADTTAAPRVPVRRAQHRETARLNPGARHRRRPAWTPAPVS